MAFVPPVAVLRYSLLDHQVGIQMFRGRLLYRCADRPPIPDSSGFDWTWQGVGDLTYSKHCYPTGFETAYSQHERSLLNLCVPTPADLAAGRCPHVAASLMPSLRTSSFVGLTFGKLYDSDELFSTRQGLVQVPADPPSAPQGLVQGGPVGPTPAQTQAF